MLDLIKSYIEAKAVEAAATEARVAIGDEIARQVGAIEEGSQTVHVDGYKVKTTVVMNRKVDWPAFDSLQLENPPIRMKKELDMVGYRWYAENDKDLFEKIQRTITTTPGRTQIEIKEEIKHA